MDLDDGELKVSNHSEDKGFAHEDGSRSKSSETTSQFDPKLSSREMRKIKYYEDMFAKMANENKGMGSETTGTHYTVTPLHKPRSKMSERRRNTDHKMEGHLSMTGYISDSMDSAYGVASKGPRRSVYKKTMPPSDVDYSVSRYVNEGGSGEYQYSDGKTLLDKRLIRVQSMPMVTKKAKTSTTYTEEKQQDEPRVASVRRPRVSRWDVKSTHSPPTITSPKLEPAVTEKTSLPDQAVEEEPAKDEFAEGFADMVIDHKEEQLTEETVENKSEQPREQTKEYKETDRTESYLEIDARDLPLDVDDFLNEDLKEYGDQPEEDKEAEEEGELVEESKEDLEDLVKQEYAEEGSEQMPVEFETKLEDQYMIEQAQMPQKKKSNRGRKSKRKQELYAVEPPQEGIVGLEEDLTPMSAPPEYVEEPKQPSRRTKSQRSRKKKQEFYEDKPSNKPKSTTKASKTIARNHSGSSEKTEKAAVSVSKREFVDVVEEKFISTENLRMITMEEAERMLNICTKKNTDYEDAKKFIDNLMMSKIEHEKRLEERNPFLLDPSNIVAPARVHVLPKPEPVPENPLQISFKYRLFQTLSKV